MTITTHHNRRLSIAAVALALVPVSLTLPADASAANRKVDGVRAELERGALDVDGGGRPNAVTLRLKQGDASRIQVDVGDDRSADFEFARADVHAISIAMGSGRDSVHIDDGNGAFTDTIPTTIAGGNGDDSLNGGQGVETLDGGGGDDSVDGGRGNDIADLGRGDDSFTWDPGEGSDVIDGGRGRDTMVFNGAGANEDVALTANGGRLTFFRQPASVTMDTDDVEVVDFNALGGTDRIGVDDLSGTDVRQLNVDLAGSLGGEAPDRAADTVILTGTDGDDTVHVDGNGSGADVTGLAPAVSIEHADASDVKDSLSINNIEDADNVFTAGVAGVLQVLVDGAPV